MADGYTPAQVVDYLNSSRTQENYQGVPILAPIQRGATAAESGIANLLGDLGFNGAAGAIRSHLSQEVANTKSSASNVTDGIKSGNYGAALEAVPSALLEGALPAAATIGAGAVAGPVAGVATAAGIGALTQGDALARARAANNGHAAPDASDLALGLAGGAGVGALGSVGLPGVVGNAAGTGLKGALLSTAAHGAADALQPQADSLAGSVGTSAGAQLAPASDSAAAALEGIAGRAATAAPGVASSLTPASRSVALADRWTSMAPQAQQLARNVVGAHQALQDATAGRVGSITPSPRAAAATASDSIMGGVKKLVGSLQSQGLLDDDGATTINSTMATARAANAALSGSHLASLEGLGLAPNDATTLQNAAMQMNVLSDPDSLKANVGPFQTALRAISGHTGGAIVGGLLDGYHGAGAGYALGGAVRPVVRSVLGGAGAAIDGAFGLDKSPLERSAGQASAMLNAAGVTVPNTQADLAGALTTSRDALTQQRQIMGLLSQVEASAQTRSDYFDASAKDQSAVDKSQAASATLKQQQMNAMEVQQRADLAAGARRKAEIEAAYQSQQPNYDAAFADMEKQQQSGQQNSAAVAANTRSQVAAYMADQAGRRGAPAWSWLSDPTAADMVASAGSPRPSGTTQGLAVSPSGPTPLQVPTGLPQRPVATPAAVPGGLAADPSGLSAAALAQARRLPAWVYGIGSALENALQVSGQARPVAMHPEVMGAVDRLQAKGFLPADIAGALRGHDGRIVPLLYGLIRNEALLHNGIDRTVGGTGTAGTGQ